MFFNGQRGSQINILKMPFISDILDSQDTEIFIADKNCDLLLMNRVGKDHVQNADFPQTNDMLGNCADILSYAMPTLCKNCPNENAVIMDEPEDFDIRDKDGGFYKVRYSSIAWLDGTDVTAMFIRNVNRERMIVEKLNSLAYIDQLTNVPNRRKLQEDFEAIAGKITGCEISGALAIFDLDHFKTINDSYGHSTGDVMLKRLTDYLENDKSFNGHLYRLGGDEFVLFYVKSANRFTTLAGCRQYFDELFRGALRPYSLPNIEMSCTLSMGVSFFPWHGDQYSELLRKADIALYRAKENGRNQICCFEEKDDTAKSFRAVSLAANTRQQHVLKGNK